MNDPATHNANPAVRASDAEREQAVALLRRNFADGRLTRAELEERAGSAYAARTRAELGELTADLPAAEQPARPGSPVDNRLLIILLCVHPPAALVYWLLCRCRQTARPAPPQIALAPPARTAVDERAHGADDDGGRGR